MPTARGTTPFSGSRGAKGSNFTNRKDRKDAGRKGGRR